MKPFIEIQAEQRSPEWFAARLGRLTASAAKHVGAFNKDKSEGAKRRDLRVQLVLERITNRPIESDFTNEAMEWGIAQEAAALAAYESLTGQVANKVGFLSHAELMIGCSPDGIIGDFVGGVELKAPKSATHYGYLRGEKVVPSNYLPQILHSLWVTGSAYWDFLSFHPAFPPHMQTFYVRVDRSHVATELQDYIGKALKFLKEVDTEVAATKGWDALKETA